MRAAALAVMLVAGGASRAVAQGSAAIVLVERAPNAQLAARLQAELEALGFRVLRRSDTRPLEAIARSEDAVAAVAIGHELELWVLDPDTGRTAVSERIAVDTSDIAVVTASEAVRARLLRVGVTPTSSRRRAAPLAAQPPPKAAPEPSQTEREPSARVWAAGGLQHAPGGLGPRFELSLGAALNLNRPLVLAGGLALTPVGATLTEPEGATELRVYRGKVALLARFPLGSSTFTMGPGCGIVGAELEGRAEAPLRDRSVWLFAATPELEAGLSVPLFGALGLHAEAAVGVSIPRLVVRFDQREIADWGRPFALFSLGPELAFF